MRPEISALYFALAATLCFSSSSMGMTYYSHKVSVLWMNSYKSVIAFLSLAIALTLGQMWYMPSLGLVALLMVSGLAGLCIGDLYLLSAYKSLGPGRTLMLFGFQPLIVGAAAHFLFHQPFTFSKLIAILFMIGCISVISLEKFKEKGHWEVRGLSHALVAIFLDGIGLVISRSVFDTDPSLGVLQGNIFRVAGSLLGFVFLSRFRRIYLWEKFMELTLRDRFYSALASFGGTFLSLFFYLTAIKTGHLASVGAVGLSGPMFATFFECVRDRRWPSWYLLTALALFVAGATILFQSSS